MFDDIDKTKKGVDQVATFSLVVQATVVLGACIHQVSQALRLMSD
jgi:hypothetical protein